MGDFVALLLLKVQDYFIFPFLYEDVYFGCLGMQTPPAPTSLHRNEPRTPPILMNNYVINDSLIELIRLDSYNGYYVNLKYVTIASFSMAFRLE